MKITLFGATGPTGKCLIEEGLKRGMDITVVARPGSEFAHPGVRRLQGELTDAGLMGQAVRGADAVLSALGPTALRHPKDLPIQRATRGIVSAMEHEGIRRLIAVSTGTAPEPGDKPDWRIWAPALLIRWMLPAAYRDIIGLAQVIRESSLDWTMVRVAALTNRGPAPRLNIGMFGHTRHSMTISRADVATFMLDHIDHHEFLQRSPGISGG